MSDENNIYVTRPSLPPLEEFVGLLEEIWHNRWLTNNGNFHQRFEQALCEYLGVKYCSLFANGTLALTVGLQALRITGEVITTPFSFVATTHALHWNGIKPVFCDIDEKTLNIDPNKIEALITPKTTAILPVHVYGNPCNIESLQKIADTYGLHLIYDAAHAFGVKVKNRSILTSGELSTLSFHATKVFTTAEGGAIATESETIKRRIDFLKNFGFADEVTVVAPGINAKMNEIQAALGILQLKNIKKEIKKRKEITRIYHEGLTGIKGIKYFKILNEIEYNYSYFPILVQSKLYGKTRDELYHILKNNNIFPRRYFYPLISDFPTYRGLPSASEENLPIAKNISEMILCLPIYSGLETHNVLKIIDIIKSNCQN